MSASRKPQQISPGVWYYEEEKTIEVYVNLDEDGRSIIPVAGSTLHVTIPAYRLRRSLRRMGS